MGLNGFRWGRAHFNGSERVGPFTVWDRVPFSSYQMCCLSVKTSAVIQGNKGRNSPAVLWIMTIIMLLVYCALGKPVLFFFIGRLAEAIDLRLLASSAK